MILPKKQKCFLHFTPSIFLWLFPFTVFYWCYQWTNFLCFGTERLPVCRDFSSPAQNLLDSPRRKNTQSTNSKRAAFTFELNKNNPSSEIYESHFSLLRQVLPPLCHPKDTPNNTHHQLWCAMRRATDAVWVGWNEKKEDENDTSNERANFPNFIHHNKEQKNSCWRRREFGCVFKGGERYTHFHRLFMVVFQSNFRWKLLAQFLLYLLLHTPPAHNFSYHHLPLLFWGFMLHLGEMEQLWL